MRLNVNNFHKLLKKSTLFFSLNNVYFSFSDNKIESKMVSPSKDFAIILNVENDILSGNVKDIDFNFYEPQENILPFIKTLENDEVDVKIDAKKMTIKDGNQKMNLFFCDDSVIDKFNGNIPKIDSFCSILLDENKINDLMKLKKFSKFEKLYFDVKDGKLYIEVGDKNSVSNSFNIEFYDINYKDTSFCFKSMNVMRFLSIIDMEKEWELKIYAVDENSGLVEFSCSDEKYYFMSKLDI